MGMIVWWDRPRKLVKVGKLCQAGIEYSKGLKQLINIDWKEECMGNMVE